MSKRNYYELSGVDSAPEIVCVCDHTGCVVLLGKNFAMLIFVCFVFFSLLLKISLHKEVSVLLLSANIYLHKPRKKTLCSWLRGPRMNEGFFLQGRMFLLRKIMFFGGAAHPEQKFGRIFLSTIL